MGVWNNTLDVGSVTVTCWHVFLSVQYTNLLYLLLILVSYVGLTKGKTFLVKASAASVAFQDDIQASP